MILLLSYSKSWCQNNATISSTGEVDSVLVSYEDLRKANAKMIELKFEKQINDSLRAMVVNDKEIISNQNSIINNYSKRIDNLNKNLKKEKTKTLLYKSTTVTAILVAIFAFLK